MVYFCFTYDAEIEKSENATYEKIERKEKKYHKVKREKTREEKLRTSKNKKDRRNFIAKKMSRRRLARQLMGDEHHAEIERPVNRSYYGLVPGFTMFLVILGIVWLCCCVFYGIHKVN